MHDQRCNNQNDYCFIDFIDKHYNIEAPEQARWAKAIANKEGNVTIYKPPRDLYLLWTKQRGEVTPHARVFKAKQKREEEREEQGDFASTMKTYMQSQQQLTQLQLQKNMGDSVATLTTKEHTPAVQQQPIYQPQPIYQQQQPIYQPQMLPNY